MTNKRAVDKKPTIASKQASGGQMRGFHLDMKAAHYKAEYYHDLFKHLSALDYTHVFFEIEDKVRLEAIRGAEWCEAFSKVEFAGILHEARSHGLIPVPLIQTLGHLEFLLSHTPYQAWREVRNNAYMLCPSNPDAVRHMLRYIDEVGELFDNPPFFHLGADETYYLGSCPKCRQRVKAASKSAVFMEHLNKLSQHALKRGWRPMAWADHALKYPEGIDRLNRDIILVDWDYWTPEKHPQTLLYWKHGKFLSADQLPKKFFENEGRFALDENDRIRSWFYTDYLRDKGFDVIVAPAMRCGGDHVFAPRIEHLANITGACLRLRRDPQPMGVLITSWALRLNHLETQWPGLAIPKAIGSGNIDSWRDLKGKISKLVFGKECPVFFDAWEKIGATLAFAESKWNNEEATWYYGQTDTIPFMLKQKYDKVWIEPDWIKRQVERLPELKTGYLKGQKLLEKLEKKTSARNQCLRYWQMAAKAVIHKANTFDLFVRAVRGQPDAAEATKFLLAEEALRDEYRALLMETCTPASVEREIAMIFGSSLRYLMRLAGSGYLKT